MFLMSLWSTAVRCNDSAIKNHNRNCTIKTDAGSFSKYSFSGAQLSDWKSDIDIYWDVYIQIYKSVHKLFAFSLSVSHAIPSFRVNYKTRCKL